MSAQSTPKPEAATAEPLSDRLLRLAGRASVIACIASLVFHAVFLATAWVIRFYEPLDTNAGLGVPIELAIISESDLPTGSPDAALETSTPGVEDANKAADMPSLQIAEVPGGQGVPDAGDLGTVGSGLGGAGNGEGIGIGDGAGGAGGGGTSFFGVEARGNRFAFIVDISGSMEGPKLASLKRELVKSIDSLAENAEFMIFFFESDVIPIGKRDKWIGAARKNREWSFQAIASISARGGTNPAPAFASAFSLRPKPDAIYFMTDGLFDPDVPPRIAAMNAAGRKVPVHCIAFGDRSSEVMMIQIAKESGGTYKYQPLPNGAAP